MSDKVRIYQLARELEVENSELLARLDELGVEYKSVSSTLDAETADTVKQLFDTAAAKPGAKPAARPAATASATPAAAPAETGGATTAPAAT
ncbi:MAG TPA: translation initiation factor IF-2 N-terminal domain-containing protein, partial [Trueperaceae bacterium]|nr:translation initiation factor IF-2 N-terminal domain-containing protein [Trueperaceae bacterium]